MDNFQAFSFKFFAADGRVLLPEGIATGAERVPGFDDTNRPEGSGATRDVPEGAIELKLNVPEWAREVTVHFKP